MSYWIQHGYGKGDKVSRLAASDCPPAGVVLSPSSEGAGSLAETAASCEAQGLRVLLDPETYIYSIDGADGKRHSEHGLGVGALHWSDPPRRVERVVTAVLEANESLGLSEVISPSPFQRSLSDAWAGISLQFARATLDATDKPVLASVVADSVAFAQWSAVDEWLDAFTTIDAAGVYLITAFEGLSYPPVWHADVLRNVYRAIYRLASINDYEVVWGYSDLAGAVGLGAGLSGFATGWFFSLRLWSQAKWIPRTGGRQSAPRVFSVPLLAPLLADGEANVALETASGRRCIPDRATRSALTARQWGAAESWYQHMDSLCAVAAQIDELPTVEERLPFILEWLQTAIDGLANLAAEGVLVSADHTRRLRSLHDALEGFGQDEGLL